MQEPDWTPQEDCSVSALTFCEVSSHYGRPFAFEVKLKFTSSTGLHTVSLYSKLETKKFPCSESLASSLRSVLPRLCDLAEKQKMQEQSESRCRDIRRLENILDEKQAHINAQDVQIQSFETLTKRLHAATEEARRVHELQSRLAAAETLLKQTQDLFAQEKAERSRFEQETIATSKMLEQLRNQLADRESSIRELKLTLAQVQEALEALQDRMINSEGIQDLGIVQDLRRRVKQKERELVALNHKNKDLNNELEIAKQRHRDDRDRATAVTQAHEQALADLRHKFDHTTGTEVGVKRRMRDLRRFFAIRSPVGRTIPPSPRYTQM